MKDWIPIPECGEDNCFANTDAKGRNIYCTRYPDGLYHCETQHTNGGELEVHPKAYRSLKSAQQFFERKEKLRCEKNTR